MATPGKFGCKIDETAYDLAMIRDQNVGERFLRDS